MKKLRATFCGLLVLLSLAGCAGTAGTSRAEELALTVRGEYLAAQSIQVQAEITADYGQRVYTFTVRADVGEDETQVEVLEPETVAGMRVCLSSAGNVLEYDGVVLELGALDQESLTPVGGISALVTALREGYIDSCSLEEGETGEQVRILCRDPEQPLGSGTEFTLWVDAQSHQLLVGEASVDGEMVLRCVCTEFTVTAPEE